ncbi:MAG: PD-(D/E)XK nuclease family protein [Candidatus Sungbacteria bacterium]|uniref:PD-(D/E)XK nuclease family protein n=1 Tax=Candidatus Sungiibacteriota bacterium TaxID=2750080 RepID=A0A933DRL9_9BACT|nr:PD-(D/E)XK nuclease family protein [Candidatus Sungbacteria bacterium]
MRTSYSALETYKLCTQKFKFQVIDRIPASKPKAAIFGTHVHRTLRYMFSADPLFPTLDQVLDFFRNNFPPPDQFDASPEEKDLYLASGERMLKNFYARNAPWNFSVVDLESHFEVLMEDTRRRETHVLAGRIDRIDKTATGYEVIDYKTNRRLPSQAAVDADLQMSIYALGLQKRWPHLEPEDVTLSLYFLKHSEKLSTRRTAASAAETAREVLGAISEIQGKLASGERFEPIPGPYCAVCPYQPICPAWRHLYRKQEAGIKSQEEIDAAIKEYFSLLKAREAHQARLDELKLQIRAYMEAQGYDRLFGEDGYIARTVQKRFGYDFDKVRAVLEPLGKWPEILVVDSKRLKTLLPAIPPEARSAIAEARTLIREFTVLTASAKKIPAPESARAASVPPPPQEPA